MATRRTGWKRGLLVLVTTVAAGPAAWAVSGQPVRPPVSSGSDQRAYTISDNVDLVLLDASVKDSKGGYVTDLDKSDFRIYEDGHPRQITQFARLDTPVTLGLVVDNSGSMGRKRPYVIMAGLAFAKESNPQDEFFVVNFNDYVGCGLSHDVLFTDNLQQLRSALYFGAPQGRTALYDAIAYAIRHLELGHRDKRTLIVVSDGRDNVSKLTYPELLQIIKASRATIYTVGLYEGDGDDANPSVLRKMAHITGGKFFEPQRLEQVQPTFDEISRDIRNRYTLGYAPDEVNDKHTLRSVKVTAQKDGHKLLVRTRTTYTVAH
ncbi:MAG: VWA domain-containing protein [Acidobacteriaceae bacterium]|nr:VWA domain-containing protein [Acidobacteriaceae bacterium]